MRAALVNKNTGVVENVILLDEDSDFTPPNDVRIVIPDAKDTVSPGDKWVNGVWKQIDRTPVEAPVDPRDAAIAELQETVQFLVIRALEA